jgi:hypothetical protein
MYSKQQRIEEEAVLALCRKFLSGIKNRNPVLMHSCILPSGSGTLIRPPLPSTEAPQILNLTLPEIVNRIPFDLPQGIEENIAIASWEDGDDGEKYEGRKSEVRVDYDLAMAWTPYEVRIGGKVTHVGTNIWSLLKMADGRWVISGVADTTRQPEMGGEKVAI